MKAIPYRTNGITRGQAYDAAYYNGYGFPAEALRDNACRQRRDNIARYIAAGRPDKHLKAAVQV